MAATKPDDPAGYIVWLRGANGLGVAFATTFQRELKEAEQKLGPAAELDQGAAAMAWRDMGRMTKFDVSNLDISATAYSRDTDLWWNITGAPLVEKLVAARRKLSGSAGAWWHAEGGDRQDPEPGGVHLHRWDRLVERADDARVRWRPGLMPRHAVCGHACCSRFNSSRS